MKYVLGVGSGAMIYIPSFKKLVQAFKFNRRRYTYTQSAM
jgi:hypothetical protein